MYGLIESGIVILILATIFLHPAARTWVSQIKGSDRWIAMAFLALLMTGQAVNASRTTFPFVRWSMYTEIFEDEPIAVGKFQALHVDGTTRWINPIVHYPSLCRNLHDRLAAILVRRGQGKLSDGLDEIFEHFMLALGKRYQNSCPDNPVVEVRAILQRVVVENGRSRTSDVVVKVTKLRSDEVAKLAKVK